MAVEVKTMEVKKPQQQLSKPTNAIIKDSSAKEGQWLDFLGEVKSEFKKISWTTPKELQLYTKIVVIAVFLFGMGIYLMDLIIRMSLEILGFFVHLLGG